MLSLVALPAKKIEAGQVWGSWNTPTVYGEELPEADKKSIVQEAFWDMTELCHVKRFQLEKSINSPEFCVLIALFIAATY